MRLTIEVIAALYLASFAWFWTLCEMSLPDRPPTAAAIPHPPKLIPFERGIELRLRRGIETLTAI